MEYLQNMKVMNHLSNEIYAKNSIGEVYSFPEDITIHVSNRCNYKCIMCTEWRKPETTDLSATVLDNISPILPFVNTVYITGGEPLLYKHLEKVFRLAATSKCDVSMVTNGSLFTDKSIQMLFDHRLSKVKFSLDAATAKTYKKIRGGDLARIWTNISRLVETKRRYNLSFPRVEIGFVAMRSNIHELSKFIVLAKSIGVDHIYVSYCHVHFEEMFDESLFHIQEESDRQLILASTVAESVGMSLSLPPLFRDNGNNKFNRKASTCYAPWRSMFLWSNGDVSMCCGGGAKGSNLLEHDFPSVWNHKSRVAARKMVNTTHPPAECVRCFTTKQNASLPGTHFATKEWQDRAGQPLREQIVA